MCTLQPGPEFARVGFRGTISRLSLLLSAAVPGPNVGVAGMTGERCQSTHSATASSWRISHTPPSPSCLPSILPLPIIVNQGGIVSAGGAVRQEIAEAAGCTEEHGCVPPDRGPLGAPFQEPAQARWHAISQTFAVAMYKAQRVRNEGGETLTESSSRRPCGEHQAWGGCQRDGDVASSVVTGLVRKMT